MKLLDDLAQSTAEIYLTQDVGNTADYNLGGFLQIYNPASTTYVKHFTAQVSTDYVNATPGNLYVFVAGYGNTTSAINAVRFKMSSRKHGWNNLLIWHQIKEFIHGFNNKKFRKQHRFIWHTYR
jgi:hypothetical protein